MNDDARGPIRFGHFSTGLQVLLILILVGSCAGGSSQATQDDFQSDGQKDEVAVEVSRLRQDVRALERQVRLLRSEERRRG